jgi:hypothetical protein
MAIDSDGVDYPANVDIAGEDIVIDTTQESKAIVNTLQDDSGHRFILVKTLEKLMSI